MVVFLLLARVTIRNSAVTVSSWGFWVFDRCCFSCGSVHAWLMETDCPLIVPCLKELLTASAGREEKHDKRLSAKCSSSFSP